MLSSVEFQTMWTVKFLAIALLLLIFVREAESWWGRRSRRWSSTPPCNPRDCQVSFWSTWSVCTHQCGTSGTKKRRRTITVIEACGGSCPYHLSEIRSCNTNNCQNLGTPTSSGCACPSGYNGTCCEIVTSPVDGDWSYWSNWSPCPLCTFAIRNRTRTCTNLAPAFGGKRCIGHSEERQICPTDCSVTATLTLNPRPSSTAAATTPTKPITPQPPLISSSTPPCTSSDCQLSFWSTWSVCTHQCGTSGTQTRTRTITVIEACGGSCPYHLTEIRSCNTDNCQNSGTPTSSVCSCPSGYNGTCCEIVIHPINGDWSDWSNWSPCPRCTFAFRNRTRTCTNPAPAFGGKRCIGHSRERQICRSTNCSVKSTAMPKTTSSAVNTTPKPTQRVSCTSLITSNTNFAVSSSSEGPSNPVLHGNNVWCAGVIDAKQYLKVDLGDVVWINQVSVQGKPNSSKSVTQYYIQTSTDNINFAFVLDGPRRKAFFGPFFTGNTVVTTKFTLPVHARYVLFNPTEPLIASENHLCMRVDIVSCQNVTVTTSTPKSSCSQSSAINATLAPTIPATTQPPFNAGKGKGPIEQYPMNFEYK